MPQRTKRFTPLPGGVFLAVHPEPQPDNQIKPLLGLLNKSGKQKIKNMQHRIPIVTLPDNCCKASIRNKKTNLSSQEVTTNGLETSKLMRTNRKVPKIRNLVEKFQKRGRIDECPVAFQVPNGSYDA